MRTLTKEAEEKRQQKNTDQRKRYASLIETEKLEKQAASRKRYASLSLEKKEAAVKKQRQRYSERKERLKMSHVSECISANSQDKGQQNASFQSSFEIGSSSSYPFWIAHPGLSARILPLAPSHEKRITKPRTQRKKGTNKTMDSILKNIASEPNTLPTTPQCRYCLAKRFWREPNGFCCSDGEVALISNDVPDELYELYTSLTDDVIHFRTYVQIYSNTFAFTSFGVKYDEDLCQRNQGIYTFKVQGQVYHYINDLTTVDNPSYMQLYFYDTEHELDNRIVSTPKLKASVTEKLIQILKVNPYAAFFRSLTNIPNLSAYGIIIRTDPQLDQRIYNSPLSSQVAAIWLENSESVERKERDIIVYNHAGYSHKVQYYYDCFDYLQYPLLFSYGDSGWHDDIERNEKKKRDTM